MTKRQQQRGAGLLCGRAAMRKTLCLPSLTLVGLRHVVKSKNGPARREVIWGTTQSHARADLHALEKSHKEEQQEAELSIIEGGRTTGYCAACFLLFLAKKARGHYYYLVV